MAQTLVQKLLRIDRRWIFLLMGLSVLFPIVFPMEFPEVPSQLVVDAFHAVDELPPGSKVWISFDYDPGSEPELGPMAAAWVWHCARKGHKLYLMDLWPLGQVMIQNTLGAVLEKDFGPESTFKHYVEGEDYVVLGFRTGGEAVIRLLTTSLKEAYPTDIRGVSLSDMPITRDVASIRDMDLIISIGAGLPGTKEWIQYAATPYEIPLIGGVTGVSTPLLYPYYPDQMQGLLGAIKGAAEYEQKLTEAYPGEYGFDPATGIERKGYKKGLERMGPQLIAHCLILLLIIGGNIILFFERRQRGGASA